MLRVTRTFLGIAVQTAKYLGSPHTVVPYSTVNESLTDPLVVPYQPSPPTLGAEISGSYDAITDTDSLRLQLMVIGNQGHRLIAGPPATTTEVPHKGTDAGLYGLIPFVAKPVTNDLTALQRTKYRLRKTMMIDGILYAVYYGRVIDISGITPTTQLTRIVDGTPVTTNFSPTINNLRPPVPAIGIDNDGSYVNVSSPLTVEFTDEEVTLLKEAAALVFGNENYAIISEIGFCTGVDKEVTDKYPNSGAQTPAPVTPATYYENVATQINLIASVYFPVSSTNAGFTVGFDFGATEPLYGASVN
jgi:hypothetical protein